MRAWRAIVAAMVSSKSSSKRLRAVAVGAAVLVVAYFAVCAVVLRVATTARRATCGTPAEQGVVAEALSFASADDGTALVGWLIPPLTTAAALDGAVPGTRPGDGKAIVLVHGLDSCGWAGAHRDLAQEYARQGFTAVVFDLRGQGRSGDAPLGLGFTERGDVKAAVGVLRARGFAPGKIGLHGTSYGAGTSLLSAAYIKEVGAVVADSAFADVRMMVNDELARIVGVGAPFAPGVVVVGRLLYGLDLDDMAPVDAVGKIAPRPIFFLHGDADERIPVDHVRMLSDAARAANIASELWILPGAHHTEALQVARDEFLARTSAFFARHL